MSRPEVLLQSHVASLDLAFYDGDHFPEEDGALLDAGDALGTVWRGTHDGK